MIDYKTIIIVSLIIGVGGFALYSFIKNRNYLLKNGIKVPGIISDIVIETVGYGMNTRVKYPIVSFKTKEDFLIKEKNNVSGNYSIGEEVVVFYNPENPKDFIIKHKI